MAALSQEATSEAIATHKRLEEIDFFMDIVEGRIPKDIFEFAEYLEIYNTEIAERAASVMMTQTFFDVETAVAEHSFDEFMEEREVDIQDPFVQKLKKEYIKDKVSKEKFENFDKILECAKFEYLDDGALMSLAYLLLKGTKELEDEGKKIPLALQGLDKELLSYLVIKNLNKVPLVISEETIYEEAVPTQPVFEGPKNIYADNCPEDAIREGIEKIVDAQKIYLEQGLEVPEELLIPQEIIFSPKNIEFLIDSQLVTYVGAGNNGNEIQFYWEKTENMPALELRTERREDGKFVLTYIKEEAFLDKPAFTWDNKNEAGKKGVIVISKRQDALEDICGMKM